MNETNTSSKNITSWGCAILFALPFVSLGVFTLTFSLYNIFQSYSCKNWDKTVATVESVEFIIDNDEGESYVVKILYSYSIKNKEIKGDNIGFGYGNNNTDNHRELYEVLKNAKKIMIYVNPKNQTESLIVAGINNSTIGLLIFSVMWNSMLLFFCIPVFVKKNVKNIQAKSVPLLLLIWLAGTILLTMKPTNIEIEKKIEVIEKLKP